MTFETDKDTLTAIKGKEILHKNHEGNDVPAVIITFISAADLM